MNKIFVSHLDYQNQIPKYYANQSLLIIFIIIFFLIIFSLNKKETKIIPPDANNKEYFTVETSKTLRGVAILLLIFGHLSVKCIESTFPFEYAGRWAVIIFLFISGFALTKTYGIKKLGTDFLVKRARRLVFPVWITLFLFYSFEFLLLNNTYSFLKVISNFLGIITPGPPNGPAWFVSYIIFFYFLYYSISFINTSGFNKFLIILFLSYLAMFCITYLPYGHNFDIWKKYTIVYPISILIGLYHEKIFSFLKSFYCFSSIIYFLSLLIFLFQFFHETGLYRISHLVSYSIYTQIILTFAPLSLILSLTMLVHLMDNLKFKSKLLLLLGEYSFEIYLLHLPFMEYYDFLLFRRPLVLYFFIYIFFVIFLSYQLKIATKILNGKVFVISSYVKS